MLLILILLLQISSGYALAPIANVAKTQEGPSEEDCTPGIMVQERDLQIDFFLGNLLATSFSYGYSYRHNGEGETGELSPYPTLR